MSPTTVSRPPIDDLPAEVLLQIFHEIVKGLDLPMIARWGQIEENMKVPLQFGHVSRRWRDVAISDPSLWTGVHINHWSLVYAEFFKRSAPLPIDLSINTISSDMSTQHAENFANRLKEALDDSLQYHPHPAANRIRTVRLITKTIREAIAFTSMLERFKLPSLTSFFILPDGSERYNKSYPNFNPPMRESLTSLALYRLSRGLKADGLRDIFTSCPRLETLILGVLELEDRHQQAQGSNATVATIHAPTLKILAVASPIFQPSHQDESCSSGCPCVFRDIIASNLEYLEVAGEVSDALHHLTPLINRRAHNSQPAESPSLKVMINAGGCSFNEPGQLLLGLPPNIHLHLFADTECNRKLSPQVNAWIQTTCSTTFYLPKYLYTDYLSDEYADEEREEDGDPLHPLASFPHLPVKVPSFPHRDPRRSMIPVLVHPTTGHRFLNGGGIDPGPYHDPATLDQRDDFWDHIDDCAGEWSDSSY